MAAPSERRIKIDGEVKSLKLDVRLYTYKGSALLTAARVYQGQTTNFRTPGGGFAPVFVVLPVAWDSILLRRFSMSSEAEAQRRKVFSPKV